MDFIHRKNHLWFFGSKMHLVRTYFIFELLHSAAFHRGGRYSHRLKSMRYPPFIEVGDIFLPRYISNQLNTPKFEIEII